MMTFLFLIAAGFLAAFIDAIAGGGGLISLPAYLIAGLPPHVALGTNKLTSTCGTAFAALKFWRKGNMDFELIKYMIPMSALGAVLGAKTVLFISREFLAPLVMGLVLAVGIYTIFSKTLGQQNRFAGVGKKSVLVGMIFALTLGFYDGFFGPGTGTFLMFGMMSLFKFDFVHGNGNTKALNLTSNIAALCAFAVCGNINYVIGIPVALAMIAGGQLGAHMAIKNGATLIRPVFVVMSFVACVKIFVDYFA